MTERRRHPQQTSRLRAGTPTKTGSRSYSIAVPPALAEAIPPGQIFWAGLEDDGSLVFRPLATAPAAGGTPAKKPAKKI